MRAMVEHPAGGDGGSPCVFATIAVAFERRNVLGLREVAISRLHSHGPHARVPTHRGDNYLSRCKARFRPAGSALVGQDSHLLDDEPNFQKDRTSFPIGLGYRGRTPAGRPRFTAHA